jgi:hypothetical protein
MIHSKRVDAPLKKLDDVLLSSLIDYYNVNVVLLDRERLSLFMCLSGSYVRVARRGSIFLL